MKTRTLVLLTIISTSTIGIGLCTYIFTRESQPAASEYHTVKFDSKGGSKINDIIVEHGKSIEKPTDPTRQGFTFENWKNGENSWDFSRNIVLKDLTLEGTWDINTYQISYDLNGGSITETNPLTYNIQSDFSFSKPTKDGSIFVGWYDEENVKHDNIKPGMTGDLSLSAKWIQSLIVKSLDETRGQVETTIDDTDQLSVTVKNIPIDNKYHNFVGWYNENDQLLSTNQTYSFKLSTTATTYINAKYFSDAEEDEWNINHGFIPTINTETNTATYGFYPQNHMSDTDLIKDLNKLSEPTLGDYYYLNHEYYVKKDAVIAKDSSGTTPLSPHNFDDGEEIIENNSYWFKAEAIEWKILETENNNYKLLSESLLDVVRYYNNAEDRIIDDVTIHPNNYKHSNCREWLNGSFLNNAFLFDSAYLNTMEIDNSVATMAVSDERFECENTFDKVSLLSYLDYSTITNRKIYTTDFSRSSRASYSNDSDHLYTGYFWTRSPYSSGPSDKGTNASRINKNGTLNSSYVAYKECCVQPLISINLD